MAPKRKMVSSVVKTTQKVVGMVVGPGRRRTRSSSATTTTTTTSTSTAPAGEGEELIQESVEEEDEESPALLRTIPIEGEEEKTQTQEPEAGPPEEPKLDNIKIATPPRVDQPRPREAGAQPEKTAQREGPKGPKRVRRRNRAGGEGREGYKIYVHRVPKQVHPELGISGKAITVVNNFMADMFERLAFEAGRMCNYAGRRTMSAREVQGAVKLLLPGELGKHAVAEGSKAVCVYFSHDN